MNNDVARLRERADHLLGIALRAREHGQTAVAEELTEFATKVLEQVGDIEHSGASVTIRHGIG